MCSGREIWWCGACSRSSSSPSGCGCWPGRKRSRALAVITAVYTAAALLSSLYNTENILFRLGWTPSGRQWSLTSLPDVLLPALVLLAAGAGAFAVQRRHRTRA